MSKSVVVDTNPLVYIYHGVSGLGKSYAGLFDELAENSDLIIPKIVYGELSLMFDSQTELDTFLADTGIRIENIPKACYVEAAKRWQKYNRRRVLGCHRCGHEIRSIVCDQCGSTLKIRQHILSDFLIGAFALSTKSQIIATNDKGYYKTYFPELKIISC